MYNKSNVKRSIPKIQTTNLAKTFETFEEGYTELIKLIPEIKEYGGDTVIYDVVIKKILETIGDNIPSPTNSNYPNTFSFSIESHEVGLKTDTNMAFGWRIAYVKESAKLVYKFRITFITVPTYRKSVVSALYDAGWVSLDVRKQSRFWDTVEGKKPSRSNNNRKRFHKEEEQSKEEPDSNPKETTDIKAEVELAKDTPKKEVPEYKPIFEETESKEEIGLGSMKEAFEAAYNKE